MGIDNLRLYPDFDDIYRQHVERAKFEIIKGSDFKSLKERLTFVRHLLAKHQDLSSEKRAELIQALISEGDLHHAQKVLPKSDKNKESATSSWFSKAKSILSLSKGTDEESLKAEMKTIVASGVSDPDFLFELKTVDDDDLKSAIQEAFVLAQTQLSSSIDTAVKKMTHAVSRMQVDYCKKAVQHEMESEKRKMLDDVLLEFIREINANSAQQRDS
jgi:hypothetical protein